MAIYEHFEFGKPYQFRLFDISERQKELHCHNCLELDLVQRGSGRYIIGGKVYPVEQGDIFVINNSEHHLALHGKEGLTMTVLLFESDAVWKNRHGGEFLKPFLNRTEGFSNRIARGEVGYEAMANAFGMAREEASGTQVGWQMVMEAAVDLLLSLLYRYYNGKREIEMQDRRRQPGKLDSVFAYIDAHFMEAITLEQLAGEAAMSRNYLCKCFKEMTGQTLFSYIQQVRIRYACYLLQATDKPVALIAAEAGFDSISYFNRVFRRHCHTAPVQFRRESGRLRE